MVGLRNSGTATAIVALLGLSILAGCAQTGDGETLELKLGTMLPLTGALASIGPDMERGAKLAIKHVNAADAGIKIQGFHEDDKTSDAAAAPTTFSSLVDKGVSAVIGPCCTPTTSAVLDLAKQNQVLVATPSATAPGLSTERDNQGYFWRAVSSDAIQGKVLAALVAENNATTVGGIIVNNGYGNGLWKVFREHHTTTLSGVITAEAKYDDGATTFSSQVDAVCGPTKPAAVVLVAYVKDGANILKEMQAKGCLGTVKVFASEGVYDAQFVTGAGKNTQGAWLADGVMGTTPDVGNSEAFKAMFQAEYGEDAGLYSHETYDSVIHVALAALKAKSTEAKDFAPKMREVANAGGLKGTDFKVLAAELKAGRDVDYQGYAHDFDFDARGDPVKGFYSYWMVVDGNLVTTASGKSA